jgi:AraC family transcriptional activator of pyochelin receptor
MPSKKPYHMPYEPGTPEIVLSTCETQTCRLNFHGIMNADCDLRFAIITSFKKNWMHFANRSGALFVKVALKNNCLYKFRKEGPEPLLQGQYILGLGKRALCTTCLPRAGEYHVVEISFSQRLVNEMALSFPRLKSEEITDPASAPPPLVTMPDYLPAVALDIIYTLIRSPFEVGKRPFYFKNKSRELLVSILKSVEKTERANALPERQIKTAEKIRQLLLKNIHRRFLISELAELVGWGPSRIKEIFKQVFGISIYHCLLQERMRVAKKMITETEKPIHEIASLVGYEKQKSFIRAFKQYYNCTPASHRMQKRI